MYFSQILLQEDAPHSLEFWNVFRNPYTLHEHIWRLFSDHPNRNRDFLYRLDKKANRPIIHSVSARKPNVGSKVWQIETKQYEPKFKVDMHLAFTLRANPVRTKRDNKNRQHRHDVVMEAKMRLKEQGISKDYRKSLAIMVQEEGYNWLSTRAERCGFSINQDHIRVDGYQQHKFFKGRMKKPVRFSTLDFTGILTVSDSESFLETIFLGIGPAKGFGCGMIMVKRT